MIADIRQLFAETSLAFDKSPIKEFAIENNFKWYYSISSTRLERNNSVIVGFNWGASKDCFYGSQTELPAENFKELYDNKGLGSLQRVYQLLKQYFPEDDIDNCIQTNFCFFRSKKQSQITVSDLELSTPLFEKLLGSIKPKRIIGFSNKLRQNFLQKKLCSSVKTSNISSNRKTLLVVKGTYVIGDEEIPIYFLPHPNAQFTGQARQQAWEFCFSNNENNIK